MNIKEFDPNRNNTVAISNDNQHNQKNCGSLEQKKKQNHKVLDRNLEVLMPVTTRRHEVKPINTRGCIHVEYGNLFICEQIKELVLRKVGTVVEINQEKLVFDVQNQISRSQDIYFRTHQYHALIGEILDGTNIPDLIRAEKLILIARKGNNEKQIALTFIKSTQEAYIHTLNGNGIDLKIIPATVYYNHEALTDNQTSMLRVGMSQLGFADGSPRYLFTTGLKPCICVTLFDKIQNKALLGHFSANDFTSEKLLDVLKFCNDQEMKNLECHIVGGTYEYLGVKNGFLSLIDFLATNRIPIKQLFVGDTSDRPKAVVLDTKEMTLYGLPFSTLDYPTNISKLLKNERTVANMPLLSKDFTHSLLTCNWDAQGGCIRCTIV